MSASLFIAFWARAQRLRDYNYGKWMGYINAGNGFETTSAGGAWIKTRQTVKLTHTGYPIWHGFFSNQVNTTTVLHGKTYTVTGHYHHFNGSWYDSLYSGKKWIGYVNHAAVSVQ